MLGQFALMAPSEGGVGHHYVVLSDDIVGSEEQSGIAARDHTQIVHVLLESLRGSSHAMRPVKDNVAAVLVVGVS